MSATLTFVFPNEETRLRFAEWMCDGGGEDEFAVTGSPYLNFDYHQGKGFIEDGVVVVTMDGEG